MGWLRFLGEARALPPAPPVASEAVFRAWCRDAAHLAKSGADLSKPTADDRAADLFSRIVDTDVAWRRAYPLICGVVQPVSEPVPISLEAAGSVGLGTPVQCWDVLSGFSALLRGPADFSE
jgi:hypothetical protein